MNENERWIHVLKAHRDEHDAMRERNLGRMAIFGRPRPQLGATVQMPEPFSPYSLHQVNLSPYGIRGLGQLTDTQKTIGIVLGGAALAAAAFWFIAAQ
ncbi:MAG: hypothetical protein GY769_20265 [bacterium]|nr:hypothetical protein [bacterium]